MVESDDWWSPHVRKRSSELYHIHDDSTYTMTGYGVGRV